MMRANFNRSKNHGRKKMGVEVANQSKQEENMMQRKEIH